MSLRRYEKPTIVEHPMGHLNPFAHPRPVLPGGRIDGVRVRDLLDTYGSPLFVLSESELRRRYRDMQRAFSLRYPKVTIAYSYKTNYLATVCSILHQEGAWAEVVSGTEYEFAQQLGVPGHQIIFNGPMKSVSELERAIVAESIINADSLEEIRRVEAIASRLQRRVKLGIRINMVLSDNPWDRFGFNLESGAALEAARRVASSEHLTLAGLHTHIGTYITDVRQYERAATRFAEFCEVLQQQGGITIEYLDFGGGFASKNRLHGQWLPVEQVVPTMDAYAEALTSGLLKARFAPDAMPRIFLEPGRALIDEPMHLLCSVVSSKRLSDGRRGVVVDAGINLLPCVYWYRYEIVAAGDFSGPSEEVNLYGNMCMNIDCLQTEVSLPPLHEGDALVVKHVGAYNLAQSMQFIQPRPAVVMLGSAGVEVVRQAESASFLRQLDVVPERLRGAGAV